MQLGDSPCVAPEKTQSSNDERLATIYSALKQCNVGTGLELHVSATTALSQILAGLIPCPDVSLRLNTAALTCKGSNATEGLSLRCIRGNIE